jgi:hypothetical protein
MVEGIEVYQFEVLGTCLVKDIQIKKIVETELPQDIAERRET